MSPEPRTVISQACGCLALRIATTMEAAAVAVEHMEAFGCDPADALIHPLEVGRGR